MKTQIDLQKRITRDALSYVAELKREHSIFHTPSKSISSQFDSVSHVDANDFNMTQVDWKMKQERNDRLMELLQKSETKK